MHELYDNQTIYQRSKRYVEEPKFDVFLNPTKKEKQVDWIGFTFTLFFFKYKITTGRDIEKFDKEVPGSLPKYGYEE